MSNKWEVHSLDVWGNEDEGFEVNQEFHTGRYITVDDINNDVAIVKELIDAGMLNDDVDESDIVIEGNEYALYLTDSKVGYPLFNIEPEFDDV